ncbi:hypothetical protein H9P43_010049 [Blastocladiella emersonii ATCC 22665]|nr:hypothetical protein H9P43_010049 [Blastocladiella emersonii ATCC 22665]
MFRGEYHGKQKHAEDLVAVLERAKASGVERMMVTGGNLKESREALALAKEHDGLYSTVGVHPTRCLDFGDDPDAYYGELLALAQEGKRAGKVVAIGECGLDYDRLHFCPADVQRTYFARQFELARETGLPMFLHDRNPGMDMHELLSKHRDAFSTGVVHSFTGTVEEVKRHLDLGLYIGINGCSLKTEENLEMVKAIPLDRLMLETDAPWCDIRPTHASAAFVKEAAAAGLAPASPSDAYPFPGYFFAEANSAKKPERHQVGKMVKGRNEPCAMIKVLLAVAAVRGEDPATVAGAVWDNATRVFYPHVGA